ncbi:hypothetical protein ES707_15916 [subsurface metagenome]
MVHLANKSQPVRVGVLYPRGVYSRVASCAAFLKAPATTAYGHTFPVGIQTWLLGVKVWFAPHLWAGTDWVQFKVLTGTGTPGSYTEILSWDNVLPILYSGNTVGWWVRYETFEPYEWNMNQHFSGKGRRFGIAVEAGPPATPLWCLASFEISEG